ncbi:hypothetical protein [Microbacterium hatanonis]|uniref:Uncharacterized protein n=1 Tax=Microbacterium hatanonis TaxID=404366 RepID=A0A5C8I4W1_9MICO|nr:hypothetical protein [Microbacterium hatanonis]TXK13190.1 hypothetical protein FVP77_07150 [Microbacterium hatanonis]
MKTVLIARGAFLTGSEIADAVSAYALALHRAHDVDTVDIPFLDAFQTAGRVTFSIGEGIEMATVTSADRDEEMFDIDTVLELHLKAGNARMGAPMSRGATVAGTTVETEDRTGIESWNGGVLGGPHLDRYGVTAA